jgi:hypothetical protein
MQAVKTWLVFFMLFAVTVAHGQRSEVPEQPQPSIRPAVGVSHIRGYLANPIAARIPNAVITLQKKKAGVLVDVQSIESSSTGEFDFGKKSLGVYQLVARARGLSNCFSDYGLGEWLAGVEDCASNCRHRTIFGGLLRVQDWTVKGLTLHIFASQPPRQRRTTIDQRLN